MASLRKLRKISDEYKYCVYGWMRQAKLELQLKYIPLRISSMCVLYVYEEEIFEDVGRDVKLSENKKCITVMQNESASINYGVTMMNSSKIYKLDLKVYLPLDYGVVCVGASNYIEEPFDEYNEFGDEIFIAIKRVTGRKINNRQIGRHASFIQLDERKEGFINVSIVLDIGKSLMRVISKENDVNQILQEENNDVVDVFKLLDGDDIKYKLMVAIFTGKGTEIEIIDSKIDIGIKGKNEFKYIITTNHENQHNVISFPR